VDDLWTERATGAVPLARDGPTPLLVPDGVRRRQHDAFPCARREQDAYPPSANISTLGRSRVAALRISE
jgi:hypothetical protein